MNQTLDVEQFDALLAYLLEKGHLEPDTKPKFTKLEGGVSNRTVLVEGGSGRGFVLKQALERLRVATEWHSDPRRIEREALGLTWLAQLAPAGTITPLLFLDRENHLLGMAAVPQPHANWKSLLLAGEVQRGHVEQFAQLLALVHCRSEKSAEMAAAFEDRSYFESLRLEPYYQFAAGRVPQARPFLEDLITETRARRLALVHGDYSPKNVLVHEDRLVLLDHEVIHFGDPTFDLGFSLTHFLSKAHHVPGCRRQFLAAACEYWGVYKTHAADLVGKDGFEERAVRQTIGCLLARVQGRSPLEYLSAQERWRQEAACLALIASPPGTVAELVDRFGALTG